MSRRVRKSEKPKVGKAEEPETRLNPALQGRYKVVNTRCPKVLNTPIGVIDFRTLTEEQAEQLVVAGFEFLERV